MAAHGACFPLGPSSKVFLAPRLRDTVYLGACWSLYEGKIPEQRGFWSCDLGGIQLGQVFKGVDDATTAVERRAVRRTVGGRPRSHGR